MKRILIILLILSTKPFFYSQEFQLREEAPTAVFQTEINDAEVEFFLSGSWKISLIGSTGIMINSVTGVSFLDGFPGMEKGLLFKQTPELTFSVWLMKKYFLELSYTGDSSTNRFIVGYQGDDKELVKKIAVGNDDIGLPDYSFLKIPETGSASLGVQADLQTPLTGHNFLLRFDNNEKTSKLFIGSNEVVEYTINPYDFKRGQYFKLPDKSITGFVVYIEDTQGTFTGSDGRKYRLVSGDEAVIDLDEGFLILKKNYSNRILVYYTKNNLPVGTDDPELGVNAIAGENPDKSLDLDNPRRFYFDMGVCFGSDMQEREITVDAKQCMLLWEPGIFSPFELNSIYEFPVKQELELWRLRFGLVHSGTSTAFTDLPNLINFRVNKDDITIFHSLDLRQDFLNLYPLPDTDRLLYGPFASKNDSYPPYEILLQVMHPVTEFYLEPDIIPGSISILRNGLEETDFIADYTTGSLVFNTYIYPDDRIEVFYKRKNELLDNGDIVFGWGNKFHFSDLDQMEIALGLRWNGITSPFSIKPFSRTGAAAGSISYSHTSPGFEFDIGAAASLTNPDTTGILLADDMESQDRIIDLNENYYYPSSIPQFPLNLTRSNRGKLFYKDFKTYDVLGNMSLMPLSWAIPADQVSAYTTNARPGPYNALDENASSTSPVLVMDFELPAADSWAGIQVPLNKFQAVNDLSSLDSLSIIFKTKDVQGSFRIYVQAGDTGEDQDGDGIMDYELSASSSGYIFNDTANNANLVIGAGTDGTGNNIEDSEDFDRNGFLDSESNSKLLSLTSPELLITGDNSAFTICSFSFTAADKEKLTRCRALRVIAVNTGIGQTTGKFIVSHIRFSGTAYFKRIINADHNGETLSTREIPEVLALSPPQIPLDQAFSSITNKFNKSNPNQKVLEIQWDNLSPDESSEIIRYLNSSLSALYYKKLSLFFRIPVLNGLTTPQLSIALIDPGGKGIQVSITMAVTDEWSELTLDIPGKSIMINNQAVTGNILIDKSFSTLSTLVITISGAGSGLLYIDALHFKETDNTIGAAARVAFKTQITGPLLSLYGFPLLANLVIQEKAALTTPGFSDLYSIPGNRLLYNWLSTINMDIIGTHLDINFALNGMDNGLSFKAGHNLKFPANFTPFYIMDIFDIQYNTGSTSLVKENRLLFQPIPNNSMDAKLRSEINSTQFVQNWDLNLKNQIADTFINEASLALSGSQAGRIITGTDYFSNWLHSYPYLILNQDSTINQRVLSITDELLFFWIPLSLELKGQMQTISKDFIENSFNREHILSLTFSLPIQIVLSNNEIIEIKPVYQRMFSAKQVESGTAGYQEDYNSLLNQFPSHPYIYDQWPVAELFMQSSEEGFAKANLNLKKSVYTPELSLSISKNPGSHIYDLLIPSSLLVSMQKEFKKEAALFHYTYTYSIEGRNNAINLFGQYGVYSLFSFYNIDEFASTYSLEILTDQKQAIITNILKISNLLRFDIRENSVLSLENSMNYQNIEGESSLENRSIFSYSWNIQPQTEFYIPVIDSIDKLKNQKKYFVNKEEIQINVFSSGSKNNRPFNCLVTHKTILNLGKSGFISAELSIGYDLESGISVIDNEFISRIGLKGGIEAQLMW